MKEKMNETAVFFNSFTYLSDQLFFDVMVGSQYGEVI